MLIQLSLQLHAHLLLQPLYLALATFNALGKLSNLVLTLFNCNT